MNSGVGEKYTAELLKLFEQQNEGLYSGRHSLCLTVPCLLYLQKMFTHLQETSGAQVPAPLTSYQLLLDHFSHIQSLSFVTDRRSPPLTKLSTINLRLEPFRALQTLIVKKVPLNLVIGLKRLRGQLRVLIVQRCDIRDLEDVLVRCGGDNSTSLAWSCLKELDLSNNKIMKLGESLQYLPCLEKVNFGNNIIGKRPHVSGDSSGSGLDSSGSAAVVTPDQPGDGIVSHYTEGIESIDSVQFLHLGFNKLRQVPRFGSRAKYNLKVLNLRNNELVSIDGLEELDNLIDLDLTDNLLGKHLCLKPFHNLHHLCVVLLQGNPLSFHPKHRQKTAENLSNLIDKNSFKLDGKKLSSSEKKVVPNSMTHFSSLSTLSPRGSISISLAPAALMETSIAQSVPITHNHLPPADSSVIYDEMGEKELNFTSVPNTPQNKSFLSKGRKKVWHTARIVDSDEETPVSYPIVSHPAEFQNERKGWHTAIIVDSEEEESKTSGSISDKVVSKEVTERRRGQGKGRRGSRRKNKEDKLEKELLDSGSVPLMHEQKLKKHQEMRLQMTENWLQGSLEVTSSADDQHSATNPLEITRATQPQAPSNQHSNGRHASKTAKGREKGRGRHRNRTKKEKFVDVSLNECEGEFGPRTSSPDRDSPLEIDGDYYLVERYESDVEDEKEEKDQVFVRISDKFLEEINTDGNLLDRWDLHCLKAASIDHKLWKSTSQKRNVLLLQFNLERRDRRRREYVLVEEGDGESIMEILKPIAEQNESTLSMGNKLECLHCQRVFDMAQANEQPSNSPEPLRSSANYRGRSISKLMCPFCGSQILQQSMRSSYKVGSITSKLSAGSPNGAAAVSHPDPDPLYSSDSNVHSGFKVGDASTSRTTPECPILEEVPLGNSHLDEFIDQPSLIQTPNSKKDVKGSTNGVGEQTHKGADETTQLMSSPHRKERDVVSKDIPEDVNSVNVNPSIEESSPAEAEYLQSFAERHLAESKPATLMPKEETNDTVEKPPVLKDASALEDTLGPWKSSKKKSLNPFEDPDFLREKQILNPVVSEEAAKEDGNFEGFVGDIQYSDDEVGSFGQAKGRRQEEEFAYRDESLSPNPYDYGYQEQEPDDASAGINIPPPSRRNRSTFSPESFNLPNLDLPMSMPTENYIHSHFPQNHQEQPLSNPPIKNQEGYRHSRSKSTDYHPAKIQGITPPSSRKEYRHHHRHHTEIKPSKSPHRNRSYGSLKEKDTGISKIFKSSQNSSGRSSLYSLDSDSSPSSRSDGNSSGGRHRYRHTRSSNEKLGTGHGSGEIHKSSSSHGRGSPTKRHSEGTVTSLGARISKVFNLSDVQGSNKDTSAGKNSGGSNGKASSESGDNSHPNLHNSRSYHSSSDGTGRRKLHSPLTIYKDDDPTFIHNNLNLYLDIEIFDGSKGEVFRMVFRSPVVKYGEPGERSVLVVISNLRAYMFQIIAPESSQPEKWLNLVCNHSLHKLVYIDHGVAYQFLRVEFKSAGACYTFLMRDDYKCKICSTQLSLCVADAPGSSLRNVGVCPFNIDALRYPDRVLHEVKKSQYKNSSARKSPVGYPSSATSSSTEDLVLYRLAYRYRGDTGGRSPVTLVVTSDTLFLAKENFAHWPLPRIQDLPPKEALLPPYLDVEEKSITDVEKIILDRDQLKYIIIRFFHESASGGESLQWNIILSSPECVTKLAAAIRTTWEAEFETSFPVCYK